MNLRHRLALLAVGAAALLTAAGPAGAAPLTPEQLTLRLTDLAPGYYLPFGGCNRASLHYYAPLGAHARPQPGCMIEFARMWTAPGVAPGPSTVLSAAVVYRSQAAPQAALREPGSFASFAFDPAPDDFELVGSVPIGDEAVLLRVTDGSYAVVWRSGTVLAAVLTGRALSGPRPDTAVVDLRAAALQLAAAQQARIATPTPLGRADDDASEVALDDPDIDVPVWWLGRALPRRGKLPQLRLATSASPALLRQRDVGPAMIYGRPGSRADVVLVLTSPRALRRPTMRRRLRRLRRDPCSQIRRVAVRDGRATIFQRSPRCPKLDERKTPDALTDTTAVVVLRGVVVLADADDCTSCHGPVSRYESIEGMLRIVRALRPREPRGMALP